METDRKITEVLENIEKKFQKFPLARRTPYPLRAFTADRGGDGYRTMVLIDHIALDAEQRERAKQNNNEITPQ